MIVLFNKPFGVLCQFTDRSMPARHTLAEFGLPPDVYAAGRLDYDSEGLVLLTDDGALVHRVTDPRRHWPKTYVVQVEGVPDDAALQRLREGVELKDGRTRSAQARALERAPAWLWPRDPPVRFRRTVADSWLELTLREGR
ncbi:MAG TPA: pseudouridine synthase, partial [Rudaea sp.]|nr:pseudouridine synthase [Rudaea sp.]